VRAAAIAALAVACGGDGGGAGGAGGAQDGGGPGGEGQSLAERYPGDVGIESDPAVVFRESFEASLADVLARWEDSSGPAGLALIDDVPAASSGRAAIAMTAGGALPEAADIYTRLPGGGHDQLYVRWYANYAPGGAWHHSGVWFGGYNPPMGFPRPVAGERPAGDDRLSVSFEAIDDRMDFYNYWMNMHSGAGTFFGNSLVHDRERVRPEGTWFCIEVMVRLNPDPASRSGGELALWWDDVEVVHFTEAGPPGYWIQDDFCANDLGDDELCEEFHPGGTPSELVDLQVRTTTDLQLNYLWPQNFNGSDRESTLAFDDIVVATQRIGCIQ